MEHSDPLKNIINFAFHLAIRHNNLIIVEQCLSEGAIITSESIKIFSECFLDENHSQMGCSQNKKIFNLLLKNGFDVITNKVDFMYDCITCGDKYYIESIINSGYDGDHGGSFELLYTIIERNVLDLDSLGMLLYNEFYQHIQPLLILCVESGSNAYLPLFIKYGANCYSVLHELSTYVSQSQKLNRNRIETINIILENMYDIDMLCEPIFKYLLIKSINYAIPIEIVVYIFKLYMSVDYKCSDDIKEKLIPIVIK